jgi:hypothetical protein
MPLVEVKDRATNLSNSGGMFWWEQMKWSELRQVKSELNNNPNFRKGSIVYLTIQGTRYGEVREQVEELFRQLDEGLHPDWLEEYGFSELVKQCYGEIMANRGDQHFTKVPHRFLDEGLAELSGSELKVLLAFGKWAGFHNGETFVSLARIAAMTGIDKRHLHIQVRSLTQKGFLVDIGKHSSGTRIRQVNFTPEVLEGKLDG